MCLEEKESQCPIWMFSSGEQCLLVLDVLESFHPTGHHKKSGVVAEESCSGIVGSG